MGITDGKLLYCNGDAEGNMCKKVSTLEYRHRTVYYCFNNNFTAIFGSPDLRLPPINIDDRPPQHKIARYNPDLLLSDISVASENSVSTLTTPSDMPDLLPTNDPTTIHVMNKYLTLEVRVNIG